jgi:competence protein ComGC
MKKMLTVLLIISILMSLSVSIVLAEGAKNSNPGNETTTNAPAQLQGSQAQSTMNQYMARFESDKLEMTALRTQTKAQLESQSQITEDCKLQLREMNQAYLSMSDEERAEHQADVDALKSQIRAAHKYSLQIDAASQEQTRSRLQDCVIDGTPTASEVEETSLVLD